MPPTIPEKCLSCPLVIEKLVSVERLHRLGDELIRLAVSSELDEMKETITAQLDESAFAPLVEDMTPDEIIDAIRSGHGQFLAFIQTRIDSVDESLTDMTKYCKGVLKLQAERDEVGSRVQYRVTVCGAPTLASVGNETSTEKAIVRRREIET